MPTPTPSPSLSPSLNLGPNPSSTHPNLTSDDKANKTVFNIQYVVYSIRKINSKYKNNITVFGCFGNKIKIGHKKTGRSNFCGVCLFGF